MNWFSNFIDLLFPRCCEACDNTLLTSEKLLCVACLLKLPTINDKERGQLSNKFEGRIAISDVFSFLKYAKGGNVQKLLHKLKYKNKPEIGVYLGNLYGNELKSKELKNKIDILTCTPMYQEKQKQRGYNQADAIGMGLSQSLEIPLRTNLIIRTKPTGSQTRKNRLERFLNTENTIKVIDEEGIKDKRIAIIDDVLTTGATIEACGEALLQSGCKELYIITIAAAL